MADGWGVDRLDLDGYLARVGRPAEPPGLAALTALLTAHIRTFTFDNLDVLLGDHPGVSLPAVEAKFVGRGRGGYCFEHASLFSAVLERLGYAVVRQLGRVGDAAVAPRTHLVAIVELDGQRWLCDPGFGHSSIAPVRLADGAETEAGGWRFRIREVPDGEWGRAWQLARGTQDDWEVMHTTDEVPVRPVDVAMGHHWTSTQPTSHFRTSLMCVRRDVDEAGTATTTSVSLGGVTVRRPGLPTGHRDLDLAALPAELAAAGANLHADETTRLVEAVRRLMP